MPGCKHHFHIETTRRPKATILGSSKELEVLDVPVRCNSIALTITLYFLSACEWGCWANIKTVILATGLKTSPSQQKSSLNIFPHLSSSNIPSACPLPPLPHNLLSASDDYPAVIQFSLQAEIPIDKAQVNQKRMNKAKRYILFGLLPNIS